MAPMLTLRLKDHPSSLEAATGYLTAARGNHSVPINMHGQAPSKPTSPGEDRVAMTYAHGELNLVDPGRGYTHVVLYTEMDQGVATAINASVIVETQTPYAREWLDRLQRCEPNALHATIVSPREIPKLFHPCVYDDKNSPAAVAGDGCTCFQTYYDPEFRLPVVADHFRTVSGNIETWKHHTIAPLDLRPSDRFSSLVIDQQGAGNPDFWVRTGAGILSLIPQQEGCGYGIGYGGGGPHALARYIQQLIASGGTETAAVNHSADVDERIFDWACNEENARSQELTLADLKKIPVD